MTKRDFNSFINQNLKGLSLEKRLELLCKIQDLWLPDIKQKLDDKLDKNYTRCSKCKKYSLIKSFKYENKKEIRHGVTVYRDCGYGDDDEIADVTYSVVYAVCPICGGLTETNRYKIGESNRHRRR